MCIWTIDCDQGRISGFHQKLEVAKMNFLLVTRNLVGAMLVSGRVFGYCLLGIMLPGRSGKKSHNDTSETITSQYR